MYWGSRMTIETVERGRLTGVTAVHQLVLFVAVWCLVSFTVSPRAYLDLTAWHLAMMTLASPVIVVIALGVPSLIAGWDSPVRYVHDKVNSRWANALFVAVGFALCLAAFSTLKTTFPEVVPFWADKWLANADKSLYGHSPWRFAHAAVGRFWAGWLFNAYEYLWTLEWLCVPIALAFCASVRTQLRYYWALALTFVIGGLIVAAIFSSGGPIFYDRILGSTRFAELDAKLIGLANIGGAASFSDYLYSLYLSGHADLGSGISAMPSMHVAVACLNACLLASINRWAGLAGWLFAAVIMFGSVYTGWHYSLDGYASILIVSAIWYATGRWLQPTPPA